MSSSTSPTRAALCLLALVVIVTTGAASASNPLPGSCLMAASTLCTNADTNAMRCLHKLAMKGDARVPTACAEAIMAGVTVKPRLKQATRTKRMSRMLTEATETSCGTCVIGNSCPCNFNGASHLQCNDGICSGCPHDTFTVPAGAGVRAVVALSAANPNGIHCANMCCKGEYGAFACCRSYTDTISGSTATAVDCLTSANSKCSLP